MDPNDIETEKQLQAAGKTAPRVTPDHIDSMVIKEDYHVFPNTTLTVCALTLRNGFVVTGNSAAASLENFDPEIGKKISKQKAMSKIWDIEGYLLKEQLRLHQHIQHWGDNPTLSHLTSIMTHEVNRLWCQLNGDFSQQNWIDAPQWQRNSISEGIEFHLDNPNAGPEASHENWRKHKEIDGWTYGEVKDPEAKTHPCMVPFDQLPLHDQIKDRLFQAVIHAIMDSSNQSNIK